MAYSDIQDRLGQQQMANSVLLAEKYSQGNLFPKGSEGNPYSKNPRAQSAKRKRDYKKAQDEKTEAKRVSDEARQREFQRRKERGEVFGDMPPDFNLMETLGPSMNKLLQIGGAVGGGLRFLTNPLGNQMAELLPYQDGRVPNHLHYNNPYPGGNPDMFIIDQQEKEDARKRFRLFTGIDLAMNFEDTGLGDGGFISTDKPHIYINRGAEAYILMPDGDFRFDGMYDPKRHGNAFPGLGLVQNQRNDDMKIAKLPHTPPTEKMVVGNKLMDSPLRFRSDADRIRLMEDYSKGFRYDGT
tara:strand:+ start:50 stop:943 length:894 start_codon:yes stop_codon:yes gene_type:complete